MSNSQIVLIAFAAASAAAFLWSLFVHKKHRHSEEDIKNLYEENKK